MEVTPLAGVWIEIKISTFATMGNMSLPLRECGLKFDSGSVDSYVKASLPLRECGLKSLANDGESTLTLSLPLRECGLKSNCNTDCSGFYGHSPCGSVD